jgi:hypothetical protein
MISYSSVLLWIGLAAQVIAWPAVPLHEASGGLVRLPPADRAIAERLLHSQLGPLFQGDGTEQVNKAIQFFRVERLSLGGTPALAVQATGEVLCGASGNCSFWIIDLHQRRVVLRADGVQEFALAPTAKHGFPDVITWTHESATEHELIRWRFIGGDYERTACATHDWSDADGNPLPQPKITAHPCDPEGN